MTAPTFDLDTVKDDVGMPAGTENDAWLQRRIDGIWSRFEGYAQRYLGAPADFTDAWQPLSPITNAPAFWPSFTASPVFYLRNYPVSAIVSASDSGISIAAASVVFDAKTGLLVGYGAPDAPTKFRLPVVTYTAGYETVPADLYDCLIGILRTLWATRANDQSGLAIGGMLPTELNIADVGNVKLGAGGAAFGFDAGVKDAYSDPYIGPYAYILNSYTDYRVATGSNMLPRTTEVVAS
jgi:hypothetical protein